MMLFKGHKVVLWIFLMAILPGSGCNKKDGYELYHKFQDHSWHRFNILSFEIPVTETEKPYDIYLYTRLSPDFQYRTLEFNMVMNTPAGEERIHEYQIEVKSKEGKSLMECTPDSCEGQILLKNELYLSKPGILKIEIENLTPRIVTGGILGVGIRMRESGK